MGSLFGRLRQIKAFFGAPIGKPHWRREQVSVLMLVAATQRKNRRPARKPG